MTFKGFIGISSSGVVTYASDLWSGASSDKQITRLGDLLDLCEVGDAIMVDKGFTISDLTTSRGIRLTIQEKNTQLSVADVRETRRIANLRIYVEKEIQRIK